MPWDNEPNEFAEFGLVMIFSGFYTNTKVWGKIQTGCYTSGTWRHPLPPQDVISFLSNLDLQLWHSNCQSAGPATDVASQKRTPESH